MKLAKLQLGKRRMIAVEEVSDKASKMIELYDSTHFMNPEDKKRKLMLWSKVKERADDLLKPDLEACAFRQGSTRTDGTKGMPTGCLDRKCLGYRSLAGCELFIKAEEGEE